MRSRLPRSMDLCAGPPGWSWAVALVGLCFLAGCRSIPWTAPLSKLDIPEEAQPVPEDITAALSDQSWAVATPPSANLFGAQPAPPEHHWRNNALEKLLARDPSPLDHLQQSLESGNQVVAGNAAIGLARLRAGSPCEALTAAVRDRRLKTPMRRAAAEALALAPAEESLPAVRELIDEFGQFHAKTRFSYEPEIHCDLVRSLGRLTGPAAEPRLLTAVASPSSIVRLAALEAWNPVQSSQDSAIEPLPLPEDVVGLRHDPEAQVRAAALLTIARHVGPHAEEHIVAGLSDADWSVRQAAIAALGLLGGESACERLQKLVRTQPELVRAAAVSALVEAEGFRSAAQYQEDKSWVVRQAVARGLRTRPEERTLAVSRLLARDPNPQVQQELIASMADWPLAQAGPVLLLVIEQGGYLARRQAVRQLSDRWPESGTFPVDAPRSDRDQALARWKDRWRQAFPPAVTATDAAEESFVALASFNQTLAANASSDRGSVAELLNTLTDSSPGSAARQETLARLAEIGPPLADELERLATEAGLPVPEEIFRDVLARQPNSEFACIEALRSGELIERRRAAGKLAERARKAPFSRLAVRRLAEVARGEPDAAVLRCALLALEDDPSEAALSLSLAGLSHPHGEIRRRCCELLGQHGTNEYADALLPALGDADPTVMRQAVLALARLGRPEDAAALAPLLTAGDHGLRLETAVALAKIGSSRGPPALERLAHDNDDDIRRRTAQALGDLADEAHLPLLIELLDDHHGGVDQAALHSLPKVAGRDIVEQTGEYPPTPAERIDAWKQWWREAKTKSEPADE